MSLLTIFFVGDVGATLCRASLSGRTRSDSRSGETSPLSPSNDRDE